MSHFISKITTRIFCLVVAGMLAMSAYFICLQYYCSTQITVDTQLQRLKGIVSTIALQIDTDYIKYEGDPGDHLSANSEYRRIRHGLSQYLHNNNRVNGLTQGVGLLLINNQSSAVEIINQKGTQLAEQAGHELNMLIVQKPAHDLLLQPEAGLKRIFYAQSVSMPFTARYHGYVYVYEDISAAMEVARNKLIRQAGTALLILCCFALLGRHMLSRILSHEVLSRKKLQEYASLAEKRYKDLEVLSFVLGKSENLILLADRTGRIEWLNEIMARKSNYSEYELENFVGKELAEVSHYPQIREVIEQVVQTGEKLEYETKSYDHLGCEFWASTAVTPILNDQNEVEKLLFIDADITRLKKAESEIAKLAQFATENKNPLLRISYEGTVLFCNTPGMAILKLWKASLNEKVSRRSVLKVIGEVSRNQAESRLTVECEKRIYSLRFSPVVDKQYVNIYGEDVTEVKQAEKITLDRTHQLEQYNINITDSINYARRIQQAIIPGEDLLRRYFKDSFALIQPRDIVSGDFFWIYELKKPGQLMLALADCTGHGVPGAMMSIIGHGLLSDLVGVQGISDPALLLEKLNQEVIRSLRQKTQNQAWDGMDVSVIKVDLPMREVTFAGAYQPIYWMNGKLNVIRGDRQPIGGLHHNTERRFTNHTFTVSPGDCIYLMSDGFTDQFGGPDNKKFLARRLQALIESNHKYSMQAQSHLYLRAFESWKGPHEQIDDASMLGIKFS